MIVFKSRIGLEYGLTYRHVTETRLSTCINGTPTHLHDAIRVPFVLVTVQLKLNQRLTLSSAGQISIHLDCGYVGYGAGVLYRNDLFEKITYMYKTSLPLSGTINEYVYIHSGNKLSP